MEEGAEGSQDEVEDCVILACLNASVRSQIREVLKPYVCRENEHIIAIKPTTARHADLERALFVYLAHLKTV
jgi:hypothetical protein